MRKVSKEAREFFIHETFEEWNQENDSSHSKRKSATIGAE